MGKGCIYGIEVEQGAEQIVPDCIWYRFNEPFFLCAPTGAGKTNVAMLTILHELAKHRNDQTGEFALDTFKVVYVAPTKALIQEMVTQMTKQQIAKTQIIVTTPEKWDVITRALICRAQISCTS
ncbi:hypothetical protein EDD17DRAFT_1521608 [Pisolithus thermaeus]|nr:hypothetical protein EDD17DRAFT_1521608 [Pisolithus thermaeus]